MSGLAFAAVALTVLVTSFLSGILGMAGGLILMGVLLVVVPVSTAMVLHGTTQMASNGWRAFLWRAYIDRAVLGRYVIGTLLALALFSLIRYVPDRATVLIVLGLLPFLTLLLPANHVPRVDRRFGAEGAGFISTGLQLLSGISGPALDVFFVRTDMDRRAVVATKAICTTLTHFTKLIYFGGIIGAPLTVEDGWLMAVSVLLAIAGTTLSRSVLDRISDAQFRKATRWLVMGIGAVFLFQGLRLAGII